MSLAAKAEGQARALKGSEIEAAFTGKVLRVRTEKILVPDPINPTSAARRTDGGHLIYELVVRPDRSIIFRCTRFDRAGRSATCARPGAQQREVGIWSVEADRFCYQWLTTQGNRKLCQNVVRDGSQLRFRQLSGPPSAIDGEIVEIR